MIYTGDYNLYSFILESDGSFNYRTINFDFNGGRIVTNCEVIEMKDSFTLIANETNVRKESFCYLLKYDNYQLINKMVFVPDSNEICFFPGKALTDQYAIIGRGDVYEGCYSYVYFRKF